MKEREKTKALTIIIRDYFLILKKTRYNLSLLRNQMTRTTDNPTKSRCGAFFDIDHTVISKNSAALYVKYMYKEGKLGFDSVLKMIFYLTLYKINLLDFEKLADREAQKSKGEKEKDTIDLCQRWFDEEVVNYIYPEAVKLMEQHRKKGDLIIFLSSASVYLAKPLAEHMGVKHYLCNSPIVDENGNFTGEMKKPFCYGQKKALLAQNFADENGLDLSESFFYTDSVTDLAAMYSFGHPVAVNPDPMLRKQSVKRGWHIVDFKETNLRNNSST